jgi:hypothetical protein
MFGSRSQEHEANERTPKKISELGSSSYTPLKDSSRDPARLKRHFMKMLKNNQLEDLKRQIEVSGFPPQLINDFFEKEYHSIFNWLLMDSANDNSFQFILNLFSPEALKNKLENSFSFLVKFLNGRAGMEELGLLTPELRELDKQRFRLLLTIDPQGIKDFMERNQNSKFMKPKTWLDYKAVLQSFTYFHEPQ